MLSFAACPVGIATQWCCINHNQYSHTRACCADIIAQYLGGAIAAVLALLLYGPGPEAHSHGEAHEAEALAVQMAAGAARKNERAGLISVAANASSSRGPWEPRF